MAKIYYDVAPRYTCGSPAMVDRQTALHVAQQEKEAYEATLEGIYGEAAKIEAERLGLHWIVWSTNESNARLSKFDILTGITLIQPIMKQGFVYQYVPVYANDMENYSGVVAKLKLGKVRTQEWTQRNADNDHRTIIAVAAEDLVTARTLIGYLRLTPIQTPGCWVPLRQNYQVV
jgi:hypothetical protein